MSPFLHQKIQEMEEMSGQMKECIQQQPDDCWATGVESLRVCPPGLAPVVDGPILDLISAAIVKKACSTFVALFADVSKNGIPGHDLG